LLQAELEGILEKGSVRRLNSAEIEAGNDLDARLSKGILSNDYDTINKNYTDVDVKNPVSQQTIDSTLRVKNQTSKNKKVIRTVADQGENMGRKVILQKYKHVDPNLI
jgi:hypothetical protein